MLACMGSMFALTLRRPGEVILFQGSLNPIAYDILRAYGKKGSAELFQESDLVRKNLVPEED